MSESCYQRTQLTGTDCHNNYATGECLTLAGILLSSYYYDRGSAVCSMFGVRHGLKHYGTLNTSQP